MIIGLTGGTGFVGGATLDLLVTAGHRVRALTRRPQPPREGVEWIDGSLDQPDRLAVLVSGTQAVLHIAGVVSGTPDQFTQGNVEGTRHLLAAATATGVRRFVHISSLAAREPELSAYGRSKAEGEALVLASDRDWTVVRPPGIYGPGDTELLDLFKAARLGVVPVPPSGRASWIYVTDLTRLLAALIAENPGRHTYEVDDGAPNGHAHPDFARAIGGAIDRKTLVLPIPAALLRLAARADTRLRGGRAKLTPDRAAYFLHPDWTVDPARRPPPTLWTAATPAREGLAQTAAWYCAHGLL